jgi:hypothetical protein
MAGSTSPLDSGRAQGFRHKKQAPENNIDLRVPRQVRTSEGKFVEAIQTKLDNNHTHQSKHDEMASHRPGGHRKRNRTAQSSQTGASAITSSDRRTAARYSPAPRVSSCERSSSPIVYAAWLSPCERRSRQNRSHQKRKIHNTAARSMQKSPLSKNCPHTRKHDREQIGFSSSTRG